MVVHGDIFVQSIYIFMSCEHSLYLRPTHLLFCNSYSSWWHINPFLNDRLFHLVCMVHYVFGGVTHFKSFQMTFICL